MDCSEECAKIWLRCVFLDCYQALEKMDHRTAFCCGTEQEVTGFEAALCS